MAVHALVRGEGRGPNPGKRWSILWLDTEDLSPDPERPIDPATVELPPCLPDDDEARRIWATYIETAQVLDRKVGKVLEWLAETLGL